MRCGSSVCCTLLLVVLLVGCGSPQAKHTAERESSHLRWLLRLRLQASQQGHALKSEQDFKQFLASLDPAVRDRVVAGAGVSSTDELFVSERDSLPYVIFYAPPKKGAEKSVFGYEQQGIDGKRYVGFDSGVVEEVDNARFDTLLPLATRPTK